MEYNNDKGGVSGNPPPYSTNAHEPPPIQMTSIPIGTPVVASSLVVPVVLGPQMGPKPSRYTCKSCHAEIVTRVETQATLKTHLFAAILCFLGCWCCVCVPYCMDSCQNANHYCPNCNAYIGTCQN